MSKFTHIAHVCALMLSAHSHVMAMEALPSAATIEIIGSSTTIRNQVQGEIKDFLDDLGRGSFSFSDVATETPQLMRERIVAALGISRDSSTMNSYIHMQTLKNLWGKTHHEGVIYSMIDIVKRLDLRDEARDLYFLSAFMLMSRGLTTSPVELKLPSISYPIEEDDKYPGIKGYIADIIQYHSINLVPFLSHHSYKFFTQSPLLRNKMALLFPENKKIPLYTGFCVETGIIDYDENGDRIETESERHKVAARLYRKSKTPEALYNLALLISECKTSEDENGNPIRTQKQRDRIAVRLWQTSKVPEALYNISKWINECKTNEDENGIPITTQDQRNRIVARLLQTSKTPEALGSLGIIILKQKVNYDEYNKKINTQEERYAASARLFRQSKTAGALNSLANMIYNKQISTDENNQTVPESERNAVAARLFRTSGIQESLYNIAIMISRNQIEHDELGNKLTTNQSRIDTVYRLTETASLSQKHSIRGYALLKLDGDSLANKKRALAEYDLALQNGFNEILATYAILLEEIESIENRMHLTHTGDIKDSSNSADVQTTAEQIAIEPPLVTEAPSPFEESEVAKQIAIEAPSAAEASIPLDENEDDDDSSDSEESAHDEKMDHVASSEYSSAEYSMIKQQTAKQWKQHIEEKRRRKASEDWERKKAAARDRKLSLEFLNASTQDSIREKWLPQAVQGRVNLAQFHDERIIMLINDIKDGGNRGKPEILGSDSKYKGYMSRRITKGHRLVYKFDQTTKMLEVIECGGHYEKAKSSK